MLADSLPVSDEHGLPSWILDDNKECLLAYFPQGLSYVWFGENQINSSYPDSSLPGLNMKVQKAVADLLTGYPPADAPKLKPNTTVVADGRYRKPDSKQQKAKQHETYHLALFVTCE